ncbi:MAG: mechanosensitive ion channel family protein [Pseudomonadota bacterium]
MNPVHAQLDALEQAQSTAIELGMSFGPKLLTALLILAAGFFVARWAGRGAERILEKLELEPPVLQLLVRIASGLVMALFLVVALQNLGVELLPLIAGLGVAGAGVALAMQGVMSNLAAGLTIIFTRPFRVGEYIAIAGEEGQVETINLFNTTLSHLDHSHVVIPNRKIVGEILHNYGTIRQLDLKVGVAYDTDMPRALDIIREVLGTNGRVLQDPAPLIQVKSLADSSVHIAIKPWIKAMEDDLAIGELNQAVLAAFRDRDIAIPFPQREIRMLA